MMCRCCCWSRLLPMAPPRIVFMQINLHYCVHNGPGVPIKPMLAKICNGGLADAARQLKGAPFLGACGLGWVAPSEAGSPRASKVADTLWHCIVRLPAAMLLTPKPRAYRPTPLLSLVVQLNSSMTVRCARGEQLLLPISRNACRCTVCLVAHCSLK